MSHITKLTFPELSTPDYPSSSRECMADRDLRVTRTNNVFLSLALIAMVLVLMVAGIILWWSRPINILDLKSSIKVTDENFSPGDMLTYEISYCKSVDIQSEIHYAFVDGVAYSTSGDNMHDLPMGCHTIREAITVPKIPAGEYKLEMTRIYQPSPLQRKEVRSLSNKFHVMK